MIYPLKNPMKEIPATWKINSRTFQATTQKFIIRVAVVVEIITGVTQSHLPN